MLSNKDGVIKVMTDNGLVLLHTSHAMQVPCDSRTRGVYRIVDIQANETRDLPLSARLEHAIRVAYEALRYLYMRP
jgi:hypothetical protein